MDENRNKNTGIAESGAYHTPVLLKESIDGLNIRKGGIYVDVTFGGGGHSHEILSRLEGTGHLYSFDQDTDAEENIHFGVGVAEDGSDLPTPGNFTFIRSNFRYLKNWMRYYSVEHIDGLLADLGVSSHQFDFASRGFSFRFDSPLDMRMNKKAAKTAADILNNYDEQALADVFYIYGEMKNSRQIASAVVRARQRKPILTTGEFIEVMNPMLKRGREKKDMARIFQALRIEVNQEMDALRDMLTAATGLIAEGGRLSVITYHSLEDRIVKNVMRSGNTAGKIEKDFFGKIQSPFRLINNKVITPDADEQEKNPRSRSAKLRIAEKTQMMG